MVPGAMLPAAQVAAAQNRALEQPIQPDALFSAGELRSSTPTMADLQREDEQQYTYGYAYGQAPGQQQQQVGYMLPCYVTSPAWPCCVTALVFAARWLTMLRWLLQYAYNMPQQSVPQYAAAA